MTIFNIEVTQDDLIHGKPGNCFWCPVALAVTRALRGTEYASTSVTETFICLWTKGGRSIQELETPRVVQRFISLFDHKRDCEPFSFELNVAMEDE